MELQRLVNAAGIITLGNQVIQIGSPLAGQRAAIRLDGQVMHVTTQEGVLWRSPSNAATPKIAASAQLGQALAGPGTNPRPSPAESRKVADELEFSRSVPRQKPTVDPGQ